MTIIYLYINVLLHYPVKFTQRIVHVKLRVKNCVIPIAFAVTLVYWAIILVKFVFFKVYMAVHSHP